MGFNVTPSLIRRPRRARRRKNPQWLKRSFLNEKEGMAAIQATVSGNEKYVDAYLTISDCNRQVQLDFCTDDSDRGLHKIRRFLKILHDMEAEMVKRLGKEEDV